MARMQSDESDTKRVTIRVPTELVEEYDEVLEEAGTNRSEDLRQHMRRTVSTPATDGGMQPPTDDETLAAGYKALKASAGDRALPVEEAKSVIASKTNLPKESVNRRVLKPLTDRGYLGRMGDPIHYPMLEVR